MRKMLCVLFASAALMLTGCGDDDGGGGSCSFCSQADALCTEDGGGVTITDCRCGPVPASANTCAAAATTCDEVVNCALM